jgi:hypothetical protein
VKIDGSEKKKQVVKTAYSHTTKKFSIAVTLLGLQKETLHQKIFFNTKDSCIYTPANVVGNDCTEK